MWTIASRKPTKGKKRAYNERVQEMEHGSFTPIVMSATGDMARECSKFYSRLSEMIAEKRDQLYSVIGSWIRRKIYFSLIRSIDMCIQGSRSMTSSNDLLTSKTNDAVASEVIYNIVLVWIYEHFPPFFLLKVCDWEDILVNLWLLCQEGKHPTGWMSRKNKKKLMPLFLLVTEIISCYWSNSHQNLVPN